METIYPQPITQAMMCRLVQDYFNCPIYNIPWKKEALQVYLHSPLEETQLKDAQRAEATEYKESFQRHNGDISEMLTNKRRENELYQDYEMGTELTEPDTFTKQVYMREFIWYTCHYDNKAVEFYLEPTNFSLKPRSSTHHSISYSSGGVGGGNQMNGGGYGFASPYRTPNSPTTPLPGM